MRKTTNYGLSLYDKEDKMRITAEENSLNANMEIIDDALKEKASINDMTNYIEEHKEELKGEDGTDGKDGTDGYSPTAKVEQTSTGATITITDKNGTTATTITNGKDGVDGAKGDSYIMTESDKAEITQMVIESLGGNPVFGYVDKNNNIIMSGDIPDGTYTVVYEMEEGGTITIGNLVLYNTVEYSITNNLTSCTNSNNATTIVEGESYSATITANSGYELKSVSVTMGGSAVSVSGGNINISSVTGDIVITAVAEEKVVTPTYTNLANPSDANWKEGKRLNSSYNEVDAEGIVTTNFIPASKSTDSSNPTKIYVKGLTFGNSSNERVCQYIDQSTPNNAIVSTVNTDLFSRSGDVTIITLSGSAVMANSTLVRICGTLTGTSEDVIITVNEEIA